MSTLNATILMLRRDELQDTLRSISRARDVYWMRRAVKEAKYRFAGDDRALDEIDEAEYEYLREVEPESFKDWDD